MAAIYDLVRLRRPGEGYRAEFKPFPVLPSAGELLNLQPAFGGSWMNKGLFWKPYEKQALEILTAARADPSKCAGILGRPPTSLVHKAAELGLSLPKSWRVLLPPPKKRSKQTRAMPLLSFPYIQRVRTEHTDLLRVNELVPRSFPEWQRADICQAIMLALFENKVTLAELEAHKDKPRYFIKEYYKNQQPWQEVLGIGAAQEDDRSYEDIAVSRSSIAWDRLTLPTQIDDTYEAQIVEAQRILHDRGELLSLTEVAELLAGASDEVEEQGFVGNPTKEHMTSNLSERGRDMEEWLRCAPHHGVKRGTRI